MSRFSRLSVLVSRHILLRLHSPTAKKMSLAGDDSRLLSSGWLSPVLDGGSAIRCDSGETCGSYQTDGSKQVSSPIPKKVFSYSKRGKNPEHSGGLEGFDSENPLNSSTYEEEFPPLDVSGSAGSRQKRSGKRIKVDLGLDQMIQDNDPSPCERLRSSKRASHGDDISLLSPSGIRRSRYVPRNHRNSSDKNRNEYHVSGTVIPFDLCLPEDRNMGTGKAHWIKKEKVQEVLRPGMVLLKNYLMHDEQVDIVKTCQELGVQPGGFYQPGYKDGGKLRLQMMCLGLNWDPEIKYRIKRLKPAGMDIKPPDIPPKFSILVCRAIEDAHALIEKDSGSENAESTLPGMSPDICIANFYTTTGRLGLHQDRDESRESIEKGLPVVSFSIGDSAEFLYGENRDVERAEKVILESGDVLIFGGESRLVFHGVSSIIQNSAPRVLLDKSGLRQGRLNLTFRKF